MIKGYHYMKLGNILSFVNKFQALCLMLKISKKKKRNLKEVLA